MLVGSMRVSSETDRQTIELQRDTFLAAGVDLRQLFTDQASGALAYSAASLGSGVLILW